MKQDDITIMVTDEDVIGGLVLVTILICSTVAASVGFFIGWLIWA